MIIRLSEIEGAPVRLEHSLELPALSGPDEQRLVPGKVRLQGELRREASGVELQAHWAATVRLQCSRCLEPFQEALAEHFFLILTHAASEFGVAEQELQVEDAALFSVVGDEVDLAAIVAEQLLLALPLKPICREDCAGLCQTCGANRNRIECACRRDEVDPRLAPLLELKDRFGER
jgi:uncharacterized protein